MENIHETKNVAVINICRHVGKSAIIAQKLQRVTCNKLHMKPRHNIRTVPFMACLWTECDWVFSTSSTQFIRGGVNRARQLYKNISMLFLFPVKDGKLSTGVNATFNASCYG